MKSLIYMSYQIFILLLVSSCYEKLDVDLCHPLDHQCDLKDFDRDGVINLLDKYPLDPRCFSLDINHCGGCDVRCDRDEFCDMIQMSCLKKNIEVCNAKDDDGNLLVDDFPQPVLSDLQLGVCQGSVKVCKQGILERFDYHLLRNYEAVESLCDGLDNDCDGSIDEKLQTPLLNQMQQGVCFSTYQSCKGVQGWVSDYQNVDFFEENEQSCDGLDNDCNGLIDDINLVLPLSDRQFGVCQGHLKICDGINGLINNYSDLVSYQEFETVCDGLDNDCDGNTDENITNIPLCTKQFGICAGCVKTCKGIEGLVDLYEPTYYESFEQTCDGMDNDCDGTIDETLNDTPLSLKQLGICQGHQQKCMGSNGYLDDYSNLSAFQNIETICDGLDNDCDGSIDENVNPVLLNQQNGVCSGGLKLCLGHRGLIESYSHISNYEAVERSCDRLDNDCDGRLDEGILNCCGNGIIDGIENCDDGNFINTDACTNACQLAVCGDGIVQTDTDMCDDGNFINTDACTNACQLAVCGDGIVQVDTEICDDGNSIDQDTCTNACQLAVCGDGIVQVDTEICDDGNSFNDDTCIQCNFPCHPHCPFIDWQWIERGVFSMGSLYGQTDELPTHIVEIEKSFYMSRSEVTVAQYRSCVTANVCSLPSITSTCNWSAVADHRENYPINCITWYQAKQFAQWVGGDLPSEAQWEYVAKNVGEDFIYPWGNTTPTCEYAHFERDQNSVCQNIETTTQICQYPLGNTENGICDLGGNVWEWVLDEYHSNYMNAPSNEQAWCQADCLSDLIHVTRGGSWTNSFLNLRTTARNAYLPNIQSDNIGFRIVK